MDDQVSDPAFEKWRSDQNQSISNILSHVFKVEDEVRQTKASSRLLRNAKQSEEELCQKLSSIRQQISEYEQVLQLSLKRIDNALKAVQPPSVAPAVKAEPRLKPSRFSRLKQWIKKCLRHR